LALVIRTAQRGHLHAVAQSPFHVNGHARRGRLRGWNRRHFSAL